MQCFFRNSFGPSKHHLSVITLSPFFFIFMLFLILPGWKFNAMWNRNSDDIHDFLSITYDQNNYRYCILWYMLWGLGSVKLDPAVFKFIASQDNCKSFIPNVTGPFALSTRSPASWDCDVCSKVRASSQANQARAAPTPYPTGLTLWPMNS